MTIGFQEIRGVDSFCDGVRAMANRGEREKALRSIVEFVAIMIERGTSWAMVFSSPELDELCQELGRVPPYIKPAAVDLDCSVFLVTAVASVGGHTRVLMDLVHADPGKKKTILVTNVLHTLDADEVKETLKRVGSSAQVEVATDLNLEETLSWLQRQLASLRPARTYILQHHFDAVIAAAVQPELVDQLYYYHNCDHNLALGVHIPRATHVDFNGKGYHHCRTSLGIENNVYWPLVANVSAHRANNPFMEFGEITTATSGSMPKFDTSYLREQVPYKYVYADILPSIMRITGGRHYHIGPLNNSLVEKIRENLTSARVDQESFINIPWAEDVAAELVARQVDLYIGSFPLAGGRAAVEAMGAGVPLLLHSNYVSPFFTDINEVYPGVLSWRDPDELRTALNRLTRELLADHACRARAFYEKNCAPHLLKAAIDATLIGTPPKPPGPPTHLANSLQRFLDLWPNTQHMLGGGSPPPLNAGYLRLSHAIQAAQPIRSRHLLAILWRRLIRSKRR